MPGEANAPVASDPIPASTGVVDQVAPVSDPVPATPTDVVVQPEASAELTQHDLGYLRPFLIDYVAVGVHA